MLKQRLLTALVLMPLAGYAILGLPPQWLALLLGAVILAAAWEWSRLCGVAHWHYTLITLISLLVCWWSLPRLEWLLWLAAGWWLIVLVWLVRYETGFPYLPSARWPWAASGWMALVPAWIAAMQLHSHPLFGAVWTLFFFVLVWAADSGAYFSGRWLGRAKLAPKVSPGKTWVGLYGGLASALAITAAFAWWQQLHWLATQLLLLIAVLTVVAATLGDLFESLLKRHAQVKDSGALLPGHGGVLDRIDSLTASAPVFVLSLLHVEHFLWHK